MTVPTTLEELHRKYHGMVLSLARKSGVPESDLEDAAQNIEERFWRQGGLTWYDASKRVERPAEGWKDGSQLLKRQPAFSSMYRSYVSRSMLGEAERVSNERKREGYPVDWTNPESYSVALSGDVADDVCNQAAFTAWLDESSEKLKAIGWGDYVNLFRYVSEAAYEGAPPAKREIAEIIGPRVTVSMAMTKLREAVKRAGIESL